MQIPAEYTSMYMLLWGRGLFPKSGICTPFPQWSNQVYNFYIIFLSVHSGSLLHLFSLKNRRLKRYQIVVFNYQVDSYGENTWEKVSVFLKVHSKRSRGNTHKLQKGKFQREGKNPPKGVCLNTEPSCPERLWNAFQWTQNSCVQVPELL